ncbi:carboxypeptidase regulatory-like domain-containing protein [Odoribacter lunatus]|uniref:carboxypeptidase regulatory-like domain-containing protein n=1 Tax=Odoribacter lunatus TaxID=2941335 RepID=UPI0020415F13|nr:carboxypeptidase regulatory-like domain-containing protein [Odoribacter lunatus]
MRNILSAILIAFCLYSCTSDSDSPKTGDIYGVVTVKSTAEPMKATGVELYTDDKLLLKTVTYDDGHYEFNELIPGEYTLKVVAEGYDDATYEVEVEKGRTARADMQLSKKAPVISGKVTSKNSAAPIKNAGVALYSSGWSDKLEVQTVTSDSGYYEIDKQLLPGDYKLSVVAEGYVEFTQTVKIETGKPVKADIQLEKVETGMTVSMSEVTLSSDKESALVKGKYTSSYGLNEAGFIYAQSVDLLSNGNRITGTFGGNKDFSATIRNLKKGIYYIQAYVKNRYGTELSEVAQLEITGDPVVTTLVATNVSATTATLNGKIEYPGDPVYTEKGFVYSSSFPNPTVDDSESATTKVAVSGTSKEFSANIADLTENATYNVRTYIVWGNEVIYGESLNFKPTSEKDYYILESASLMVQKVDLSSGADWQTASNLCKSSTLGGYTDWRLPTRGELQEIYDNQNIIGQLSGWYWSKDYHVGSYYYYYYLNMSTGEFYSCTANSNSFKVRAVRSIGN